MVLLVMKQICIYMVIYRLELNDLLDNKQDDGAGERHNVRHG